MLVRLVAFEGFQPRATQDSDVKKAKRGHMCFEGGYVHQEPNEMWTGAMTMIFIDMGILYNTTAINSPTSLVVKPDLFETHCAFHSPASCWVVALATL